MALNRRVKSGDRYELSGIGVLEVTDMTDLGVRFTLLGPNSRVIDSRVIERNESFKLANGCGEIVVKNPYYKHSMIVFVCPQRIRITRL